VIDPVTEGLAEMDGKDFVKTMSVEALEMYSEAFVYYAKAGSFKAFNSKNWGTKLPPRTDPKAAVKCAAQKGKCECAAESMVYYGLKAADGTLDTSVNYNSAEADHSGYTFCKNEIFGDPLPGNKKKKYCFCDESYAMQDARIVKCGTYGEKCHCDVGGLVFYGTPTPDGRTIDISKSHWEVDASPEGITNCTKETFRGANSTNFIEGSCFCDLPSRPKHNYCKIPKSEAKEVGCY
jgi:hypothetical protein